MEDLRKSREALIQALQDCTVYQTFLEKKQALDEHPDKRRQVNQARRENYMFYNAGHQDNFDWKMDELSANIERLRMDVVIDEYLDAELALCRLVQELTAEILQSINMTIDFI